MALFSTVLRQTQAQLQGLDGFPGTNVVRRRHPRIIEGDSFPLTIVSPGVETDAEDHSENTSCFTYPVAVTLVIAGNGALESDVDDFLDWRDQIRRHFHRANPLPGYEGTIWDCDIVWNTCLDPSMFGPNYDAAQITLYFKSEEDRAD